jgi:serine O-acetyltransferase
LLRPLAQSTLQPENPWVLRPDDGINSGLFLLNRNILETLSYFCLVMPGLRKTIPQMESRGYNAGGSEEHLMPSPDKTPRAEAFANLGAGANDGSVWAQLRAEALTALPSEPLLTSLYHSIIEATSFEHALVSRLASKLAAPSMPAEALVRVLSRAVEAEPEIGIASRADLVAVLERDPASARLLEPFLFFKGFAAIETHRLAHWLWSQGKRDMALYLQCRSSEVFGSDIHPAARFGHGIFLDHATGFVAGETVIIEDGVSMLHGVTLGGSGIKKGERHPKIRTGVLIGAGAQILGNVEVGAYSKIAAGSLVTQSVPARSTAVGVPARIIEGTGSPNPAQTMDQDLGETSYDSFNYVI